MGIWLARRIDLRLQSVATAIEQVAESSEVEAAPGTQAGRMPPEFARLFAA